MERGGVVEGERRRPNNKRMMDGDGRSGWERGEPEEKM